MKMRMTTLRKCTLNQSLSVSVVAGTGSCARGSLHDQKFQQKEEKVVFLFLIKYGPSPFSREQHRKKEGKPVDQDHCLLDTFSTTKDVECDAALSDLFVVQHV